MTRIQTKRIYEPSDAADGQRILVDRLWPRGVSKERARIDFWARSIAPSSALRQWYRHEPAKWLEFRERYFEELDANPEGLAELRAELNIEVATLVFSSTEEVLNNASALREYLESHL